MQCNVSYPNNPAFRVAAAVNGGGSGQDHEDITRKTVDAEADTVVAPFWEATGEVGDIDVGISTPLEVRPRATAHSSHCSTGSWS